MTDTTKINIAGIEKHAVLRALFNASRQQGMGILDIRGAQDMTAEDSQKIVAESDGNLFFDYLMGRVMKVDIGGDEFDPWGYDRDNGAGAAARALETLNP